MLSLHGHASKSYSLLVSSKMMSLFIIDFVQADVAVCLVSLYKLMLLFTSELVQADVAVHPRAPMFGQLS